MYKKIPLFILMSLLAFGILNSKAARVGPDNYGYVAIDSNEVGGPVFDWIDITTTGTHWVHDDDDYRCVPIGFIFNFYGVEYDTVCIGSNGYLTFGIGDRRYDNDSFPSTSGKPRIAPFFDDLIIRSGDPDAGIYYQTIGTAPNRMFVVTWYIENQYWTSASGTVKFQAILYETTNAIKFQYLDTTFGDSSYDYGKSATIGIDKGDGTNALLYSYNQPVLRDGMAIAIYPPPVYPYENFGYVKIGKEKYGKYTIINYSSSDLQINNISITGDSVFSLFTDIGSNPCGNLPSVVSPGESCEIYVKFAPTQQRSYSATVNIDIDGILYTYNVRGNGDYPRVVFGRLDDTLYKVVIRGTENIIEILNTSNVPLELFNVYTRENRKFTVNMYAGYKPCGDIFGSISVLSDVIDPETVNANADFGIPPGDFCTIGINFYGGDERSTDVLYITTDDPAHKTVEIFLQSSGFIGGDVTSPNTDNITGASSSSSGGCSFDRNTTINPVSLYLIVVILFLANTLLRKTKT